MNNCIFMTKALCLALFFSLAGCDTANQARATAEQSADEKTGQDHGHAKTGVKRGSHEDWCGGHGVPESLCTRCNPELIAAFKATGDWCEGHGLPESQCLRCNPEIIIERPPRLDEPSP